MHDPSTHLARWADLEIATATLYREDSKTNESLAFDQDGRVAVIWKSSVTPRVRWRVRGPWLEIDTQKDGSSKMRLRAVTWTMDQIVAESPTGEKTVWRIIRVTVVIMPIRQRPGLGFHSGWRIANPIGEVTLVIFSSGFREPPRSHAVVAPSNIAFASVRE
jgi:hypothetical protein